MKTTASKSSRIQREIQQRRPFRSRRQEASIALLRTADVVKRRMAKVIEPAGVTLQQYNVLRILRGAGDGGIATLEIARRMIEETPGITRLLDRLETKRMVRRERCPSDRRQVLCWITVAGTQLLGGLDEDVDRADVEVLHMLGAEEVGRLIDLLDSIRGE
jgi:DNA-binding MarR family transcriptional regulator